MVGPLAHAEAQIAIREQMPGSGRQVVQFGAVLTADFEQIFESGGGHEGRARALAFEQGVGRDSGTVNHIHAALAGPVCTPDPARITFCRLARVGAQLERFHAAVVAEHDEIREGSSGVHPDAH